MRKITSVLDHILFWTTAVSAMAFFAVVLASIVVRAVASGQFHSSIELSRLFFVWSCFLAAALAYRRKAHVAFTLLFDKLSLAVQRGVMLLTYAMLLAFLLVVLYQAVLTCRLLWPTVLPILGISQAWSYIPVPVMCLFTIAYTLEFIVALVRPERREGQA
jgi:TRAP-type C4-dicarboxylate transport system permease small subunit